MVKADTSCPFVTTARMGPKRTLRQVGYLSVPGREADFPDVTAWEED